MIVNIFRAATSILLDGVVFDAPVMWTALGKRLAKIGYDLTSWGVDHVMASTARVSDN